MGLPGLDLNSGLELAVHKPGMVFDFYTLHQVFHPGEVPDHIIAIGVRRSSSRRYFGYCGLAYHPDYSTAVGLIGIKTNRVPRLICKGNAPQVAGAAF